MRRNEEVVEHRRRRERYGREGGIQLRKARQPVLTPQSRGEDHRLRALPACLEKAARCGHITRATIDHAIGVEQLRYLVEIVAARTGYRDALAHRLRAMGYGRWDYRI